MTDRKLARICKAFRDGLLDNGPICLMSTTALINAKLIEINRSDLRQNQSAVLRRARGKNVLLIKANDEAEQKVVLDKKYFDEIRDRLESVIETLEIAMDQKLFKRILAVADTLEDDLRTGSLHSIEEAFGIARAEQEGKK